jgi:transcriptional regulator with XRE-family HTH domain
MMDVMASDSLGILIRRARERKHWTQAQLADAVGVSSRAVGDWERDVKAPRNRLGALEQVLGVDLTGTYTDEYADVYTPDMPQDYDRDDPREATIAGWVDVAAERRQVMIYELRAARARGSRRTA